MEGDGVDEWERSADRTMSGAIKMRLNANSAAPRAGKCFRPITTWVAVAAVTAFLGSCNKPTKGIISGTITVDGVAPKSGAITFYPTNGKAQTAGSSIEDGHYRAEVAPGTAKVEINVPKVIGQKKLYNTPNSPVYPLTAELLPAKYNTESELKADIKLGENEQNFDLKTK